MRTLLFSLKNKLMGLQELKQYRYTCDDCKKVVYPFADVGKPDLPEGWQHVRVHGIITNVYVPPNVVCAECYANFYEQGE